jgi:two-component system response regulator DesR
VIEPRTDPREEAIVTDGTSVPAPALDGLFEDVDVVDPEPAVAVIAAPDLLRRRIVAALDYDRLPVIAHAAAPAPVVARALQQQPTVVVVAGADGDVLLAPVHEVRRELPDAHPVLVLERIDGGPLRRVLRAGAVAAISADQVETGLALAVRAASAGLVVVPQAMRERLEPPALSPREREVLALAAEGSTTTEIAARLGVALGTVKRHLSSCFAKLGVENRSEALALLVDADRDPAAAAIE